MIKEYWPEHVTRESWERLVDLAREIDFRLIGGWAVYLYTGLHKSRDIDIVVDLDTLSYLREHYDLRKNLDLRKYEIREKGFDIDVYVPYFSRLVIPPEDILRMERIVIRGIPTIPPEALLLLKLDAWRERGGSVKGGKDEIDIITLVMYTEMRWSLFFKLAKKYKRPGIEKDLARLVRGFDRLEYLSKDFQEYNKWKKEILRNLSS